jgi:hypothetical protein
MGNHTISSSLINATYHSTSSGKTTSAESDRGSAFHTRLGDSTWIAKHKYRQRQMMQMNSPVGFFVYTIALEGILLPDSAKRDGPAALWGRLCSADSTVSQGGRPEAETNNRPQRA